jgi:hypothetical protein
MQLPILFLLEFLQWMISLANVLYTELYSADSSTHSLMPAQKLNIVRFRGRRQIKLARIR